MPASQSPTTSRIEYGRDATLLSSSGRTASPDGSRSPRTPTVVHNRSVSAVGPSRSSPFAITASGARTEPVFRNRRGTAVAKFVVRATSHGTYRCGHRGPVARQESAVRTSSGTRPPRTCCARCGHQHDTRVAGSRLDRHNERVRRSGSGDEGPDAGRLRIVQFWRCSERPLAGRPVSDAIPPQPVRPAGYVT